MASKLIERASRIHRAWPSRRAMASVSTTPIQTAHDTYAAADLASTETKPILEDTFTTPSHTIPTIHTPTKVQNPFITQATCTTHEFPSMRPVGMISYPSTHLLLPLRRDILHRAVIFEADGTRQGTASTKWRDDVHGSGRKIRPQKGTGRARLGDKKSPMLKGGGVAFGPQPRDFSTKLPQKIYDLAWRTALSYRYMRGELVVIDGSAEIEHSGAGSSRWMQEVLRWHNWSSSRGKPLFVTRDRAENLTYALSSMTTQHARALKEDEVDVKDLLETSRLIIEKKALRQMLLSHCSDLSRASGMTVHDV